LKQWRAPKESPKETFTAEVFLLYNFIMKYKCSYTGGSGKEYEDGIWEKNETEKQISFKKIERSFYGSWCEKIFTRKFYIRDYTIRDKHITIPKGSTTSIKKSDCITWCGSNDVINEYADGTYVIYPQRCGTPFYFVPII
jgi:hypothetical protein